MADVAIVNISELTATSSLSGNMLFAVEIPGLGIRKIDKDTLFNLMDTDINVVPSGVSDNIITIDGTSYKIRWIDSGSNSQLQVRMNRVYFTDSDSSTGIVIDAPANRLGILGTSDAVFEMNLDGNILTMTLDKNFNADKNAYLGTSLDQQFYYQDSVPTGESRTAISCQRSIMKFTTLSATNAANTIVFPSAPKDGYTFELSLVGGITTLTLDGGDAFINDAPSSNAGTTNHKWVFWGANAEWIKII